MAKTFLSNHRVSITPLSPIHIGSGLTYEPTNYVIDEERGFLYGFDPLDTVLRLDEFEAFNRVARSADFKKINRFYDAHCDVFRPWARSILPLSSNAIEKYRKMLNAKGNEKNTAFEVFRTQSVSVAGTPVPYMPGSSIKGAIVTALLNRLNQDKEIPEESYLDRYKKSLMDPYNHLGRDIPGKLLGPDFSLYPSRLVKVGDFQTVEAKTRILFSRRFFKLDHASDGIYSAFESVIPGQYRAFEGELTLFFNDHLIKYGKGRDGEERKGKIKNSYKTPEEIFKDVHAYAYERWLDDQSLYAHFSAEWTQQMVDLFEALEPMFETGRMALIRLGQNTGAESKTLHGLNQPRICITHKPSKVKRKPEVLDHSTTLWFTDEVNPDLNGLSYGWALCELDPQEDSVALEAWCSKTYSRWLNAHPGGTVSDEWDRILEERREKLKLGEVLKAEAEARRLAEEEARKAAAKAEAEKQAELAAMSPERRAAIELCEAIEGTKGTIANVNDPIFLRTKKLLAEAVDWTDDHVKLEFAQRLQPLLKAKDMYQGKAAKIFKLQLKVLRGED